jgi:hypothetical protein
MENMKPRGAKQKLSALQESALEELFALPDDALLQEVLEDGMDPNVQADALRASVMETLAKARRERLDQARARLQNIQATRKPAARAHPSIERMKQLIQDLFARDASLGLAYRDGKQQSEADWRSLWDDLVDMGAIREDDDTNRS